MRDLAPKNTRPLPGDAHSGLRHRGDGNSAGDSDRLRGLILYLRPTRLASVSPGRGSLLPVSIQDGDRATVPEFELLPVDVDATHVGIDERGPKQHGNGELLVYNERYKEHRVT